MTCPTPSMSSPPPSLSLTLTYSASATRASWLFLQHWGPMLPQDLCTCWVPLCQEHYPPPPQSFFHSCFLLIHQVSSPKSSYLTSLPRIAPTHSPGPSPCFTLLLSGQHYLNNLLCVSICLEYIAHQTMSSLRRESGSSAQNYAQHGLDAK